MFKIKLIIALIIGMQIAGYGQWEQKNISTSSTLTCVDFINNEVGFVTGGNKIYKTNNGGDNWAVSYTANNHVFYEDIFVINDDNIIAVGKDFESSGSIITKSKNGGASWTEVFVTGSSLLSSLFFVTSDVGYCSGGSGTILKTTDSGDSWQRLNSGTTLNLQSIYFVNDSVGIAVGGDPARSIITKTMDGGVHWNQIVVTSNNNLQSVFFTNQETAYIVGWYGEILKTENCGDTWIRQNSVAMQGNLEVTFTDENTGYIVGGATNETLIQKTTNGGELWEDISPQIQEGLVSIKFPSFNVGYAVGSSGTVLKTESGGVMTNTNNFNFSEEFAIFPNPTNGILNIQSEKNHRIERLKIYDSNGRIIKDLIPDSVNYEVDLSDLESNIYYLEINVDKVKSIRKIVKI